MLAPAKPAGAPGPVVDLSGDVFNISAWVNGLCLCKKVFVAAEQLAVPGQKLPPTMLAAPCYIPDSGPLAAAHKSGRSGHNQQSPMLSASLMVSRLGGGDRSSAAQQHPKAGRRVPTLYSPSLP